MTAGAYCPVILTPGALYLGGTDLSAEPGYCLVSLQIGWPAVRNVVRSNALGDGTIDDTTYLGARAISVTLRLDQRWDKTQTLLDNVLPYLSPRIRTELAWALPGQNNPTTDIRRVTVRGADAPLVIDGPKYRTITLSFVTAGSPYTYGTEECVTIVPSDPGPEAGRTYDLVFDRVYPAGAPPNSAFITNIGNAPTDWTATISGTAVNPQVSVNGVDIVFDRNGGLTLSDFQSVTINTADRTILDNSGISVYDRANFEDWTWEQARLVGGTNLIEVSGTGFNANSQLEFCWTPYWY